MYFGLVDGLNVKGRLRADWFGSDFTWPGNVCQVDGMVGKGLVMMLMGLVMFGR